MSAAVIPLLLCCLLIAALVKKTDVYTAFVNGAKEGLPVVAGVLPYLAAMLTAIRAMRASGALSALISLLSRPLARLGFPPELLPLAALRPFSGSASLALLSEIYTQYGADSFLGTAASLMMGSSETIFYTLALYFGSIHITNARYCIPVALLSGAAGTVASLLLARLMGTA